MSTSQKKTGKGKGKYFEDFANQKHRSGVGLSAAPEENDIPGALKKGTLIMAKERNGETYRIAKIIDVRVSQEPPTQGITEAFQKLSTSQQQTINDNQGSLLGDTDMQDLSLAVKPVPDQKFEYYVNYLALQRRNDRWINEAELRIQEDEISHEFKLFEEDQKEQQRLNNEFLFNNEHLGLNEKQIQEFEEATKVKSVEFIEIGVNRCETWYFSPFPKEYHCKTLYICEYCLYFFVSKNELIRHSERCTIRCPPGDEIYRDDSISMFEIDGKIQQTYCENLCMISKLFLDHKTLHYDIDPFHFYVLVEHDAHGFHLVGYFSKEKQNQENNLSCILVMPFCQRKGYGKLLIEFSYELSLKEGRHGSPEKPLSDLGHRSYVSWWAQRLLKILLDNDGRAISIQELSQQTAIDATDITYVFENFKILRYFQGQYILYSEKEFLLSILKSQGYPGRPVIRENIHWIPHAAVPLSPSLEDSSVQLPQINGVPNQQFFSLNDENHPGRYTNQHQHQQQQQQYNLWTEVQAMQNDRIGAANSQFNSLKGRLWQQRMGGQQQQQINLSTSEISALKKIVKLNHEQRIIENQGSARQSMSMQGKRQYDSGAAPPIKSKKNNKKGFHSRAESQVYENYMSMSLNKDQRTSPVHNSFNDQPPAEKRNSQMGKRFKLKTPQLSIQRQSQHEFKVPFQIYENQTPVNVQSRQQQASTSQRFFSLRKSRQRALKSPTPSEKLEKENKSKSRSKERSLKSSLSTRSQKVSSALKASRYIGKAAQIEQKPKKFNRKKILINSQQELGNLNSSRAEAYIKVIEQASAQNVKEIQSYRQKVSNQFPFYQEIKDQQKQYSFSEIIAEGQNDQQPPATDNQQKVPSYQVKQAIKSGVTSPTNRQNNLLKGEALQKKKELAELASQSSELQKQMKDMAQEMQKKQQQIEKIKVRTAQAQSDKIELMRDLATYESNFSETSGVRSILMRMHKLVAQVKEKVHVKVHNDAGDGEWMSQSLKQKVFDNLIELSYIKQERSSLSDVQSKDMFKPGNVVNFLTNNQGTTLFSKQKNSGNPKKQSVFYSQQDEAPYKYMVISGIACNIQLSMSNGSYEAVVNTSLSSKCFRCELKPLNFKTQKQINVQKELDRIYFSVDYAANNGKGKLTMLMKDTYDEKINFGIINLKGPTKEKLATLQLLDQETEDIVKCTLSIPSKDFPLELAREERTTAQLIQHIQESYRLVQDSKGKLEFQLLTHLQQLRIPVRKWIKRIHKGLSLNKINSSGSQESLPLSPNFEVIHPKKVQKILIEDQGSSDGEESKSSSSPTMPKHQSKKKTDLLLESGRDPNRNNKETLEPARKIAGNDDISSIKEADSVSQESEKDERATKVYYNKKQTRGLDEYADGIDFALIREMKTRTRFKSQVLDRDLLMKELGQKKMLSLSRSKNNLNILIGFPSKSTKKITMKTIPHEPTQIDIQIQQYDYFYLYQWKVNNFKYHQLNLQREEEIRRQISIERQKHAELQHKQNMLNDEAQLERIKSECQDFRVFFKGQASNVSAFKDLIHLQEFLINEDQVKIILQFFTTREGEIHILISKTENSNGETLTVGPISKQKTMMPIDVMEINETLVNRLNLYTYPSLEAIREKVADFAQLEALKEIVTWQLKAGEFDKKQFKTLEHVEDIGSGTKENQRNNSKHRIGGSENKNTVRTIGEKTSSQYEETSMNDSYYQK